MSVDFRRRAILQNLLTKTWKSGDQLVRYLQTEVWPPVISDNCSAIEEVPTNDLREAMRVLCDK